MRNLFLALVLTNLAFAGWQYTRPEPDAGERGTGRDAPGIVLMSEAGGADGAGEAAPPVPDAASEAAGEPSGSSDAGPAAVELAPAQADVAAVEDAARAEDGAPTTDESAAPADESAAPADESAAPADESAAPADESAATAADESAAPADESTAAAAADEGATAADGDAEPAAADGARVCRSVGPFEELSQAAVAASTLRAEGLEPSQRVAEGEIWVGYWVYLEVGAADGDPGAILGELAEAGMTEAYVITDSDADGDVISLGVFTEAGRAERLADDVRALGYEPTTTDRTRRGTVYWVDVETPARASLDLERLQPSGRIVRLEQRPCP